MSKEESRQPRLIGGNEMRPILELLPQCWGGIELSLDAADTIDLRGERMVAAATSGCVPGSETTSLTMYGLKVVAGITVLRDEPPATRKPGEGEGNADHYVVTESSQYSGDYFIYGPFHKHNDAATNAGIEVWHDYERFKAFVDSLETGAI